MHQLVLNNVDFFGDATVELRAIDQPSATEVGCVDLYSMPINFTGGISGWNITRAISGCASGLPIGLSIRRGTIGRYRRQASGCLTQARSRSLDQMRIFVCHS
jgi:hypothetical protein